MKKVILTVFALFAFGFANAQDEIINEAVDSGKSVNFARGNMFIEGGIYVRSNDNETAFSFNPKFGYFLSDRLAVGADLDIGTSKQDVNAGFIDDKTNNFGIGVFGRYYALGAKNSRFKAFAEAGLGYSHSKREYYNPTLMSNYSNTNNGIKANVDLGLNYFFTQRLAATFVFANIISYNNENPEVGDSTNDFQLNINFFNNPFAQPQFGLLYKF